MDPLSLAVKLYDRYESIDEVKHYYGLLAIYGLCRVAEIRGDSQLKERCRAILARFPDQINHPQYNFPSYRIGGIARAYALMTRLDSSAGQLVRDYAEEMMTAPRDPKGIMKGPRDPERNLIWIDVAMAATPYLLFAGLTLNEQRYINEAARQAFLMYDEFLDPATGLLRQSKNFNGAGRYSQDHWSRGNGWGYIALTELVQYLPADSAHRPKAEHYFKSLSDALRPHQNDRGLWRQQISLPSAWEESSGTALFLYGFGVGLRRGLLSRDRYLPAFERGIRGLARHCIQPDMTTLHTCVGCLCPGQGDDKGTVRAYLDAVHPKANDVHSWGPFMLALSEAHQNGIHDVQVGE